uniref:RING-type domain-containing protein n=1 Tax=Ditylenchus dipsaci TaxID=166011 RepID=A0A915EHE8_9BILA
MGQSSSQSKRSIVIEDADRIQINSSPLHCPVCLLVFPSAPLVLPCGHTFCRKCIEKSMSSPHMRTSTQQFMECPLCREKVSIHFRRTRNFVVEDILSSIECYEPPLVVLTNDIVATQKITIQRIKQKHSASEEVNRKLIKRNSELTKVIRILSAIVGACCLSVLAYTLYIV